MMKRKSNNGGWKKKEQQKALEEVERIGVYFIDYDFLSLSSPKRVREEFYDETFEKRATSKSV